MNYFGEMEFLEPKCPGCGIILDYGNNTKFKDELMTHVCLICGKTL